MKNSEIFHTFLDFYTYGRQIFFKWSPRLSLQVVILWIKFLITIIRKHQLCCPLWSSGYWRTLVLQLFPKDKVQRSYLNKR